MAVKKDTTEKVKKAPVKKVAKVAAPKAVKAVKAPKAVKAVKAEKEVEVSTSAASKEKTAEVKVAAKKVVKKDGKYFYAVGRRKTSVAQVRLYEDEKATDNDLVINGKKLKDYFPTISQQNNMLAPLKAVGLYGKFSATVLVRGGGVTGQVEATRLGISRALVVFNAELKKTLKDLGFMTRDAREVERKKAGLKGARKAPQWAKR
jgi:small subunit ribosomal protein S9